MPERAWKQDGMFDWVFDYGEPWPPDHRLHDECLKTIEGNIRRQHNGDWIAYVSAFGGKRFDTKEKAQEMVEQHVAFLDNPDE